MRPIAVPIANASRRLDSHFQLITAAFKSPTGFAHELIMGLDNIVQKGDAAFEPPSGEHWLLLSFEL